MESQRLLDQPPAKRLAKLIFEKTEGFVFFLGAGPSREANLPDWGGLVTHLIQKVINGPPSYDPAFSAIEFNDSLQSLDNWDRIQIIRDAIGEAQYESSIQSLLQTDSKRIPAIYNLLWDLDPRGFVTLNLDDYCELAGHPKHGRLNIVNGIEAASRASILRSNVPFVTHAHGTTETPKSWILSARDLDNLLNDTGYIQFIRNVFSNFSVIFYGISPDDFAVSGQLRYLREIDFPTPAHYWILRGPTREHLDISKVIGAQIIALDTNKEWSDGFRSLKAEIQAYKPAEPEPRPIFSVMTKPSIEYIDPTALLSKSTNEIRSYLNSHTGSFYENGEFNYAYYLEFCELYKKAIRIATLVDYSNADDYWMDVNVISRLGGGVFGEVYGGRLGDKPVAIKIARDQVRRDRLMLNNFRRGVDSMRILSESEFDGVPTIIDASELPPYIVMDFVEGKSLDQIIFENLIEGPLQRIEIIISAAKIVNRCHRHDRMILHRDLRPSNIMITGDFWDEKIVDKVTVLDFDLSWHLGASEDEYIMTNASALGYLAPEQIDPMSKFNARSALVDVYGCGMLLYFVLSGRHPPSNASSIADWHREAFQHVRRAYFPNIDSAAFSLARTIENATRRDQPERIPLDVFIGRLTSLILTIETGKIESQEIAVDEVFYTLALAEYSFDSGGKVATYASPSGVIISGQARDDKGDCSFRIDIVSTGNRHRGTIHKYFESVKKYCIEQLKSGNSKNIRIDISLGSMKILWEKEFTSPEECRKHGAVCRDILYFVGSS